MWTSQATQMNDTMDNNEPVKISTANLLSHKLNIPKTWKINQQTIIKISKKTSTTIISNNSDNLKDTSIYYTD